MATKTWSLDEGLDEFLNQARSAYTPPQGEGSEFWKQPKTWMDDIGLNFKDNYWDSTSGFNAIDPANRTKALEYGPEKIAEGMGWQYDPSNKQFITPWSEDNFFGDFMEFAKIPLTFTGIAAGAGGLNSLFSGAGSAGVGTAADWWSGMPSGTTEASFGSYPFSAPSDGLTANLVGEYAAPETFLNSNAEFTGDWATQGGGVDPSTWKLGGFESAPNIGSEGDWWTDMPRYSTELTFPKGGNMLEDLWNYVKTPKGMLDAVRLGVGLGGTINGISQGRDLEKTATNLANTDKMDRSLYRKELEESYTNPWGSAEANASRRGLRQIAERAGARGGVNPIHTELALQSKLADIIDQRRRTLSGLAGAQFDPSNSSSVQLTGLQGGFNRTNAGIDQLTSAIGSILQGAQNPKEDFWKWLLNTRG